MTPITEKTIFHAPPLVRREAPGLPLLLDPESSNGEAVEPRRGISCFGGARRPADLRRLWLVIGIGAAVLSTLALAIHQGDEPVGRGPFRIRNQFPFSLLFLGHAADDAHGLEPGNFELNVNFTWSNTFVGNDRLRTGRPAGSDGQPLAQSELDAFAAAHPDQAAFFFDGEILRRSSKTADGSPPWRSRPPTSSPPATSRSSEVPVIRTTASTCSEAYARLGISRFKIVANDRCIACNECSRNCQVGIDVMQYALKQETLDNATSSCIGCGICVTVCPMDTLSFGAPALISRAGTGSGAGGPGTAGRSAGGRSRGRT